MTDHRVAPRFGLGLRRPHYPDFLGRRVAVDFVEVISENFMGVGGRPRAILHRVRADYPVAFHGVSLSPGSADGVDPAYLTGLKALVDEIEPMVVSDHLCWTRTGGFHAHDLLPLPYTVEALDVLCANIGRAQDVLQRPLLIENPSSYVTCRDAAMTEAEFIAELVRRSGCDLLLDVNNVYVSATNHGHDPAACLAGLPFDRVRQIHLAGHTRGDHGLIDTHDRPVSDAVWALFAQAMAKVGDVAVMIERDDAIPPLSELLAELDHARALVAKEPVCAA